MTQAWKILRLPSQRSNSIPCSGGPTSLQHSVTKDALSWTLVCGKISMTYFKTSVLVLQEWEFINVVAKKLPTFTICFVLCGTGFVFNGILWHVWCLHAYYGMVLILQIQLFLVCMAMQSPSTPPNNNVSCKTRFVLEHSDYGTQVFVNFGSALFLCMKTQWLSSGLPNFTQACQLNWIKGEWQIWAYG